MDTLENRIQERNREIGQVLREARTKKNIPVTTCAKLISTSRRRYVAVEQGEVSIGVAELEALMKLLGVPPHEIWHNINSVEMPHQIVFEPLPEETLQIVVLPSRAVCIKRKVEKEAF